MTPKVLWIEDSARFELSNLTGPVYFSGEFDFQQADNITSAISFIKAKEYDVLVVDVRLPPGVDPYWLDLYQRTGEVRGGEKLGLSFLYWLLSRDGNYLIPPPEWIKPNLIGVFTVESYQEIKEKLNDLNINIFKQKTAGLPDTSLLDLIREIHSRNLLIHQ